LGFTPRTKRVLELSFREARRMGHNYIGTEHLLVGILKEGESVAVRILMDLGLEPQKLYSEVAKMFTEEAPGTTGVPKNNAASSNTPTLNQFGRDLTDMAREAKFDPVIGRDKEIERVIQILSRRTKNNPCLIGEPGVGKTAIAEGLAQKIVEANIPEMLKDKRVVTLDLSSMVAGAKYRGEFEERLKKALEEIKKAGNVSASEMSATFNCGVGLVLVVAQEQKNEVMNLISNFFDCYEFGIIEPGKQNVICQNQIKW
jgi:ATP-dependent Clp protease ATP-binding subunit ClpC